LGTPARDLKDVLEAVLDGVVVVDREGRVELVNGEACRMLETSAEFAAGLPLARVADPAFEALVRSVLELGRPRCRTTACSRAASRPT
jgi:PAS domain-containing protein